MKKWSFAILFSCFALALSVIAGSVIIGYTISDNLGSASSSFSVPTQFDVAIADSSDSSSYLTFNQALSFTKLEESVLRRFIESGRLEKSCILIVPEDNLYEDTIAYYIIIKKDGLIELMDQLFSEETSTADKK
ncbi:MAG: hypothetical protein LBN05_07650 [Oscillospiraceae bacterium]|jgi:hypothetical protein|nr:hypothetical protein [Oscillospiraceae bacterium]